MVVLAFRSQSLETMRMLQSSVAEGTAEEGQYSRQ